MKLHVLQKIGIAGLGFVMMGSILFYIFGNLTFYALGFTVPLWVFIFMGYLLNKEEEKSEDLN